MPFGRKSKGVKNALDAATNNSVSWSVTEILPQDVVGRLTKTMYTTGPKGKGVSVDLNELNKLATEVMKRVNNAKGSFLEFRKSEGGRKTSGLKRAFFVGILINDVLILEPMGQVNNATFVGYIPNMLKRMNLQSINPNANAIQKAENAVSALNAIGRNNAVRSGLLRKISHETTFNKKVGKKDYNYGVKDSKGNYIDSHLFSFIDYAKNTPLAFWRTVYRKSRTTISTKKTIDGAMMKFKGIKQIKGRMPNHPLKLQKISQNMPNTVTDVISNVGKQVNNRGITAKDVSEYHDKLAYFHDQKSNKYFEEER